MHQMGKWAVFCLYEIREQTRENRAVFAVIITTVAVTLAAVLVLVNILSASVGGIAEIRRQQCIYNPNIIITCDRDAMKGELARLSDQLTGGWLPDVAQCELTLYLHDSDGDMVIDREGNSVSVGLHILPDASDWLSRQLYETACGELLSGEMPDPRKQNAAPVILLSAETRRSCFSDADTGDTVKIGGSEYIVAAGVPSEHNYIFEAALAGNAPCLFILQTLIFTEPLTDSQRGDFNRIVAQYEDSQTENLYETRRFGQVMTYLTYLAAAMLLLLFCMVTVMRLFGYIFAARRYAFVIYRLHGMRRGMLAAVAAGDIFCATVVSEALGIALYQFTRPVQRYFAIEAASPSGVTMAVTAIPVLLTVLTALPTIRQLTAGAPLESGLGE